MHTAELKGLQKSRKIEGKGISLGRKKNWHLYFFHKLLRILPIFTYIHIYNTSIWHTISVKHSYIMVVLALFRNLKGPPGFSVEENIHRSSYNHKAEDCILQVQGPTRFAILTWPAAMSLQFQCQGRWETGSLKSIRATQFFNYHPSPSTVVTFSF